MNNMKNIKSLLYAAAAVLLLPLTSCSDDDYALVPAPAGQEVYFSESLTTTIALSRDASTVEIPVMRVKTEEAETIQLMSQDESGLFTIPSSVTFAAGANKANVVISYNVEDLTPSEEYPVSLLVMGNDSEWGKSQVELKLFLTEPWVKLGTGLFRDDIVAPAFGFESLEEEVEIYEYEGREGYYYIDSPYNAVLLARMVDADPSELKNNVQPVQFIIDATDPNAVVIGSASNPQPCGCTFGTDGWMSTFSYVPGTLKDGVITFPVEGLRICFDGAAHAGKAYTCNADGLFRVVLPGVVLSDTSISAAYDGMKVSSDGETASALFNLSFGADVASYKFVIANGDATADFDDLVAGIIDGSAENVNDGSVADTTIAVALEASGLCSFVAVPYDAAGEAVAEDAILELFFFPGAGGATVPDIEVSLELGFASDYLIESAWSKYPATSILFFFVEGPKGANEVKSATYYLNKTSVIESAPYTKEELLAKFGTEDADIPADINENGYHLNYFENLSANTSYTLLVKLESIYGKTYILSAEKKTEAIPYTGELVLGDYYMTYTGSFKSENLFNVSNTEDPNKFIVTDFAIETGLKWHAVYDSTASTLTLDGTILGNESKGCLFGYLLGFADEAQTQGWGVMSYEDKTSESIDDPCVFKVDPSTKQIVELSTYLEVYVADIAAEKILGDANYFIPGTKVELQTSTASVRTKAFGFAKQLHSQNAGVQRAFNAKIVDNSIKSTPVAEKRVLRTLAVKAEPCARQKKSLGDLKLRAKRF